MPQITKTQTALDAASRLPGINFTIFLKLLLYRNIPRCCSAVT